MPVLDQECCPPLVAEPVSQADAAELARVFKALGDPVRLRLLSLIAAHAGGGPVSEPAAQREATIGLRRCSVRRGRD
ncbi:MAG TPA: hypothetical protein VF482_07305, partial [Trebonia sp.]